MLYIFNYYIYNNNNIIYIIIIISAIYVNRTNIYDSLIAKIIIKKMRYIKRFLAIRK